MDLRKSFRNYSVGYYGCAKKVCWVMILPPLTVQKSLLGHDPPSPDCPLLGYKLKPFPSTIHFMKITLNILVA